jgi:hypothetical protein
MGRYDAALDKESEMYHIDIHFGTTADGIYIESDERGLKMLKSMIDRKLALKDHSTEILIAKSKKGIKYKIRFDLR